VLGYLISAGVYGLLFLACLTLWRRRLTGSGMATAVGVQLGWSIVLAAEAAGAPLTLGRVIAAEYLRDLAWAFVLARSLRRPGDVRGAVSGAQRAIALLVVLIALAGLSSVVSDPLPIIRAAERYWTWGGLALSIAGLVLLEQVARNTRASHRWQLKQVWLAVGGLYAWDLCLFSIAMLKGRVADFWLASCSPSVCAGLERRAGSPLHSFPREWSSFMRPSWPPHCTCSPWQRAAISCASSGERGAGRDSFCSWPQARWFWPLRYCPSSFAPGAA